MKKYKLETHIEFEDVKIEELEINFEKLNGEDLINAQNVLSLTGIPVAGAVEFNKAYLAHVIAKACGKPYEFITALKANDFAKVTLMAQGFLV